MSIQENSGEDRFVPGRAPNRFRYIALKTGTKAAGVLILGMMLLLSFLIMATGPKAEPVEQVEREWPVSYSVVTPSPLSPTLQVYGRLESEQQASLRSALTATVASIQVNEGDWVNRGDVLVTLDPAEAALNLRSAEAAVKRATAALETVQNDYHLAQELATHHEAQSRLASEKLDRFESLHERRMIADSQLDEVRHEANERAMVQARHTASLADYPNQIAQAEAALSEAEAGFAQAELDMQYTQIRAPFNGRILQVQTATGDRISAGTVVLRVADYDRLRVRAPVPANVAQRLRLSLQQGQRTIASTSVAGQRLGFELQGVAGDVKTGQSGIDAFFRVAPDALMALGAVVNLNLTLPPELNVVALPVHAVYDNNRIYRIQDSRLEAVEVERVGEQLDDEGNYRVLVRSITLKQGDHIMVSQLPTAMTGLLVDPIAQGEPSATTQGDTEIALK